VGPAVRGVAEPVLADHAARVDRHPVAQHAPVVDHRVGIQHAVRPNPRARPHVHAGVQHRPVADPRTRRHADELGDRHALAHLSRRVDPGLLVDPGKRVPPKPVQRHHRLPEGEVRVLASDQTLSRASVIPGHDHRARGRVGHVPLVPHVRQEGHILRAGVGKGRRRPDHAIGRPGQGPADPLGQLAQRHCRGFGFAHSRRKANPAAFEGQDIPPAGKSFVCPAKPPYNAADGATERATRLPRRKSTPSRRMQI